MIRIDIIESNSEYVRTRWVRETPNDSVLLGHLAIPEPLFSMIRSDFETSFKDHVRFEDKRVKENTTV